MPLGYIGIGNQNSYQAQSLAKWHLEDRSFSGAGMPQFQDLDSGRTNTELEELANAAELNPADTL